MLVMIIFQSLSSFSYIHHHPMNQMLMNMLFNAKLDQSLDIIQNNKTFINTNN